MNINNKRDPQSKFQLDSAKLSDFEDCITCLNTSFCEGEPTTAALGFTQEEFQPFVETFTQQAIIDGWAHVIRNGAGKVIACMISADAASPTPKRAEALQKQAKFAPVFDLLGKLDHGYLSSFNKKIPQGLILHLLMLGINANYRGHRLAPKIVEYHEGIAKQRGYIKAFAEVTGPISQRIFEKLGYKLHNSISYKEYEFVGERVFASIDACETCDLVEKTLLS